MQITSHNLVFAPLEWSGGVIQPTNTCFDDALDYLDVAHGVGGTSYLLQHAVVHGICLWPGDTPGTEHREGERFAHAWVELSAVAASSNAVAVAVAANPHSSTVSGGIVIQAGVCNGTRNWYGLTRASFYAHMRVQRVTRYSVPEVLAENERTNHFGPWVPEYVELCRKPTI